MRSKTVVVILLGSLVLTSSVSAGTIRVLPSGGGHLISAHSPVGQAFIAEDPLVSIGLYIHEADEFINPDGSLLVQLFEGEGVGGSVLDARTIAPPAGFAGFLDVDYSHLTLEPGNDYSVTLSSQSDRWISDSSSSSLAYAEGAPIITGVVRPTLPDKAFQVVPIPEPSTGTLSMFLLLGGAAASRLRRFELAR